MAKDQYVAVVKSNGTDHEFFGEWDHVYKRTGLEKRQLAERVVREAGLTTPRNNPKKVVVHVFSLHIKQGQIQRSLAGTYEVMPYLEKMTQAEYEGELTEILRDFPEEFRSYIRSEAWNHGHSSGFEEVINYAGEISAALLPGLRQFCRRNGLSI